MNEFILELIKILFAPSAIILVIVFFLKRHFDKTAQKDLEQFKSKLSHELELAKATMQMEFQKSLIEYQTKFSFYHNKLVEIVAKLYSLIIDVNKKLFRLTSPIQEVDGISLKNKKQETFDAYNAFRIYYSENKIFIDSDLCIKFEQLLRNIEYAFFTFDGAQRGENYSKDETGSWAKSFKIVHEQIEPLIKELEIYFRKIVNASQNQILE